MRTNMSTNNQFNLPNQLYDKLINAPISEYIISLIIKDHKRNDTSALDLMIQNTVPMPKLNQALIELRNYLGGKQQTTKEPKLSTRFATTSTPPSKMSELTNNTYYKVYKDKGENLHGVDKELSEEEIEKIVKTKGLNALKHIPKELFTEEFCKEFVSLDGGTLLFVPENMRTFELCNLALDTNYMAYRYVPKSVQSDELLLKSQRRKADVIIKQAFVSSEACSSPEYAEAKNLRLRLDSADVSEYEFIVDQIEELASVWG